MPTKLLIHIPDPCVCNRLSLSSLLLLLDLTSGLDALQDVLTVLVELQLADDNVGWVDSERNRLTTRLLANDTLNVNDVLQSVD